MIASQFPVTIWLMSLLRFSFESCLLFGIRMLAVG